VATNLRRDERPADSLHDSSGGLVDGSPELRLLEQRYGDVIRGALRAALANLAAEDRAILQLHYVERLTVGQLAPILATSRATAGRRLVAARDRLAAATLAALGERIGAPGEEIRSILRALVSRLDVSLRGIRAASSVAPG
jgi:RNA polymerase sigma-70 factor